jgi:AcrR family transcriptional regulator
MPQPETLRDLRRGQIIAVGRRIVAEDGLEALTISALEARLSFSRGVITYHFEDKEDIVYAILESAIEEIDAVTATGLKGEHTFEDKIRIVLTSYVRGFIDHPEAGRILLAFWGRLGADRRARKANASLYAGYRRGAARILEEGRAAGALAPGVQVEAAAAMLVGLVLGIVNQAYFEKGAIDPVAVVDEAVKAALARLVAR